MHFTFLAILLLAGQLAIAQTAKHVRVPGTRCTLIPPAGFEPATNFGGFMNANTGASIMISEMPVPYQQTAAGFTAEALGSRGMNMLSKETVPYNNASATLVKVSQQANGSTYLKQILIFGDEKTTVLINGIYPEAARNLEGPIRNALFSTVYNAAQIADGAEAAPFSVNAEGTDIQLARYMSGSLLYSTDGKIPTEKPTLIITGSLGRVDPANRKQFAQDRLKKLPRGGQSVINEVHEISVDGMNGYALLADGKAADGANELVYQAMLFSNDGYYYLLVGHANEQQEKSRAAFVRITNTFRRKQTDR